jgi:hypothetical protein
VPEAIKTRLGDVKKNGTPAEKITAKSALAQVTKIEDDISKLESLGRRRKRSPTEDKQMHALDRSLGSRIKGLARVLRQIGFDVDSLELPLPVYKFTMTGGKAKTAEVQKLSSNRPNGSPPSADPKGWDDLRHSLTTGGGHWRRLHLISEKFGGLGNVENLVPGTQSNNSTHESRFESTVKNLIGSSPHTPNKKDVVWVSASVTYYDKSEAPESYKQVKLPKRPDVTHYAKKIVFTAGHHKKEGNRWKKIGKADVARLPLAIPKPDWELVDPPLITSASAGEFRRAAASAGTPTTITQRFTANSVSVIKRLARISSGPGDLSQKIGNEITTNKRLAQETKDDLNAIRPILISLVQNNNLKMTK